MLGPSQSSARLGFGSSFWEKKLSWARLAMPFKKLGSARLAISCKKSSVQLGLLYYSKNQVTLKNKKWADFQHFCQFLRHNPDNIYKTVFFLLKSYIPWKSQMKIVKNCLILENLKLGLARFWKQKARLDSPFLKLGYFWLFSVEFFKEYNFLVEKTHFYWCLQDYTLKSWQKFENQLIFCFSR